MTNVILFPENAMSEKSHLPAGLNLDKHFADLKLIMKVSQMLIGNRDAISLGIKSNIGNDTTPTKQILSEMKMMAEDNFNTVIKMVGLEIATEILNYE